MHCVTINVKDILTYKVILIKDQISLINASVTMAKHYSEQGNPPGTCLMESKNHHILSCKTDTFQIWHDFASDDSSIIILVSYRAKSP